ncbi:MAG: hypothetical protein AAF513_09200 [Pseudomonadota bacterium]
MRIIAAILYLLTLSACTSHAQAQEQAQAQQVTEHLQAQVPESWIKGVDKNLPNLQVTEYFPADSKEVWERKLSYEALRGEPLPDPIDFAASIAEQQADVCDQYSDKTIFSGYENGYPTMVQLYECGQNKRTLKPLVTVVKAIKGNTALYVITRIWRLQPTAPGQTTADLMPQAELAGWMQSLKDIRLCDESLLAHKCNTTTSDEPPSSQGGA